MEEMNLGLRGRGLISGRVAAIVVLEARILVARTQAHYCRDGSEPRKVARNVRERVERPILDNLILWERLMGPRAKGRSGKPKVPEKWRRFPR